VTAPEPEAAPVFVHRRPSDKNFARRVGAVILGAVLSTLLLGGGVLHALNSVVGTPEGAADTVVSITSARAVTPLVARSILDDLSSHAPAAARASIIEHRAALLVTVEGALDDARTVNLFRAEVHALYGAHDTNGGRISFAPLVARFTKRLHTADPIVPAAPSAYGRDFTVVVGPGGFVASGLESLAWALSVVGVVGAVLEVRFLVRRRVAKLVGAGLVIGLPGLVLWSLAQRFNGLPAYDGTRTGGVLFHRVLDRVTADLSGDGMALLVTAAVTIALYAGIQEFDTRRRAARSA
jgi:hypothetical protein